jgi:large subunit ribosomal protein L37e
MGRRHKKTTTSVVRCGKVSFNFHTKTCASCGFGRSKRLRDTAGRNIAATTA